MPRKLARYNTGALMLVLVAGISGCGYGKVSDKTYHYATALYSICNQKDTKRLDKLATMVSKSRRSGEISDQEAQWLADIIDDARRGDWRSASQHARRMMHDQVEGN